MPKKYLPVHPSRKRAFMLLGAVLLIYLLGVLVYRSVISNSVYNFILKPVLWLGLAGVAWIFPRVRTKAPLRMMNSICMWAFIFAAINLLLLIFAGFIDGFGKSPYDHTIKGIILNILMIGSMLAGRETVRSYTVNSLTKEENFAIFIPIALFMTIINFTIDRFIGLTDLKKVIEFVAQYFIPELLQNIMATYLAFLGGWIPALIYMGTIFAFNWFLPILPNLKWITAALVGIICPAFSLPAMQGIFLKETKVLKTAKKDREDLGGWIVTSIISIGIIWFSVGVFPIYPSVIATGSMEPMIKPGDMVLVEKILKVEDIDRLRVGDVVQFSTGNIPISHRIIGIIEEENVKRYLTKGDNNAVPDKELVKPADIRGKIKYVVPKIGWPTLLIKSRENMPLDEIEF